MQNENINYASYEDMPESVRKFMEEFPNANTHNIYHLESYDVNGNKTDEGFGVNLLTNYGLDRLGKSMNDYFYIYIGTGIDETHQPSIENSSMYNRLGTGYLSISSWSTSDTQYTLQYDSSTHLLTQRFRIFNNNSYFDYNYANLTEPTAITEIGVADGNYTDRLMYHAKICDSNGNQTVFYKRPNERLYITIYVGACLNVDLINKLWDKDIYSFIVPTFYGGWDILKYISVYKTLIGVRKNSNVYETNGYNNHYYDNPYSSSRSFNDLDTTTHLKSFAGDVTKSFLFDYNNLLSYCGQIVSNKQAGYNSTNLDKLYAFRFDKIDITTTNVDDVTLENEHVYTNNYDSLNLDQLFGSYSSYQGASYDTSQYWWFYNSRGTFQIAQADIKSMCMYNHLTKAWDIAETVDQDPEMDYSIWWRQYYGEMWIKDPNGISRSAYVFINPHPEWEISSLNTSSKTIYATDSYWDNTTWVIIPNLNDLPSEARHKRYYIQTTGTVEILSPTYVQSKSTHYYYPRLVLSQNQYDIASSDATNTLIPLVSYNSCYNDYGLRLIRPMKSETNGWFCDPKRIIYTGDTNDSSTWTVYPLSHYGETTSTMYNYIENYVCRFCTDDRICLSGKANPEYSNGYSFGGYYWRMFDVSDKTQAPTYVDFTITDFDISNNTSYFPSFSKNGYICISHNSTHKTGIIDMYNVDENDIPKTYTIPDSDFGFALNLTNYCLYKRVNTDATITFDVYDMRNQQIISTFHMPEDGNTYVVKGVGGWKNHIYIYATQNGTTNQIYYYDYVNNDNGVPVLLSSTYNVLSFWNYNRFDNSVDECYIVSLAFTHNNALTTVLISDTEPTTIRSLTNHPNSYYCQNSLNFTDISYMNNGKQLIVGGSIHRGSSNDVFFKDNDYNRYMVIDLGYQLDVGYNKIPIGQMPVIVKNSSYYNFSTGLLYNNGVIIIHIDGVITWYPIEQVIHHKMTLTSDTYTSYNNPFKISVGNVEMSFSNHMETILSVSD